MRLLLVEDEAKTAAFVARGLTEDGYEVVRCADGAEGLRRALDESFDLLILDVMLPGLDGFQLLQKLREAGKATPVLFLTARDGVRDRVRGLRGGADDYLVKPFAFAELTARVESIIRRASTNSAELFRLGDLQIDFLRQRVSRQGERLDLTQKEFKLLSLLARNCGRALPRNLIAREVWELEVPTDSNFVDVHVRRLRAKVDDPFEHKLLHTVRGVGYALENRE